MPPETTYGEFHRALTELDRHLHNLLSFWDKKKEKKSILSLAGVWKDDDETYNTFKTVLR